MTIAPPRAISGTAFWIVKKAPLTLMLKCRSKNASSTASSGVRAWPPDGDAELSSVLLPPSSTNVTWLLLWPLMLIEAPAQPTIGRSTRSRPPR